MKLEFSRQSFEKYLNIKFHENQSSGIRVVPCGRTDRHDEADSCFSQYCEHTKQNLISIPTLKLTTMQEVRVYFLQVSTK